MITLNSQETRALRQIKTLLETASNLFTENFDGARQNEILTIHHEETSLPHALRWGTQAAEEILAAQPKPETAPKHKAVEVLLDYQDRLNQVKDLKDYVDKRLNALGVGGGNPEQWAGSCEGHALYKIEAAIKDGRNLPVDQNKLLRIPENEGKGHYTTGYGRWLEHMTPEFLERWINKNIGDPTSREIANTIENVFPPYLRDPGAALDDRKGIVSRSVASFETDFEGKYKLRWNADLSTWVAFLKLCHSIGNNIPFDEVEIELPTLFDKEVKWERENLYRWHAVTGNAGISRIRPMVDGTWRFELFGEVYPHIKTLALQSFAKRDKN